MSNGNEFQTVGPDRSKNIKPNQFIFVPRCTIDKSSVKSINVYHTYCGNIPQNNIADGKVGEHKNVISGAPPNGRPVSSRILVDSPSKK